MWVIRFKDSTVSDTDAASEQGAWNAFYRLFPLTKDKSIRDLQDLGYCARKTHSKRKKEPND